jgi:hypothetical protein
MPSDIFVPSSFLLFLLSLLPCTVIAFYCLFFPLFTTHHVTRHNTPIHNILSTAQLSVSQKALGMLPEDGNVMPKHVGATIHN